MRYRKVVKENDSVKATYDYVYSDGTLILLTHTTNGVANTARFVYDSFGEPRGFILNNSATYLYLKNGQGDITAIVGETGEILVRYEYNAWGAVEFVVPFGVDPAVTSKLATVSPFTYRGYCYDYDIGMYYLQSRYYDPQICRFINADSTDYLGATGTVLSYNLFAYCENDGVNYVDETGTTLKLFDDTKKYKYAKICFTFLQKITDDTLQFNKGKVTIKKKCKPQKIKKFYGTHLIRSIVANNYVVGVYVYNQKGYSSTVAENYKNSLYVRKKNSYKRGKGSNSYITFFLKDKSKSFKNPIHIILAHELIHSYRDVKGMSIANDRICHTHDKCHLEECFVVGLHNPRSAQALQSLYTENNIRAENGLVIRKYYVGW